jgi:hypothetical protein
MICAACRNPYETYADFVAHKPRCEGFAVWDEHYKAVNAGKHRKAGRLARKALHVERETPPMPAALLETFKSPDRQRAARMKAQAKKEAIKRMRAELGVAGRRRRRILT